MFLELHIIQSFGPSVLNRDDTNTPKTAEFGGVTRARVSSQCLKRLMREHYENKNALGDASRSVITLNPFEQVADTLVASGRDRGEALMVAAAAFSSADFDVKTTADGFVLAAPARFGVADLDEIAGLCDSEASWTTLLAAAIPARDGLPKGKRGVGKSFKTTVAQPIADAVKDAALRNTNVGVALFGRMIAMKKAAKTDDESEETSKTSIVEACCSVAHAISTHRGVAEFDFFTAVDAYADTTGAAMMGDIPFSSAAYYRVVALDLDDLRKRVGDDFFGRTLRAFVEAVILLAPKAKQSTFLANEAPSLVLAVVRSDAPQTLANAFERPVRPAPEGGYIEPSIRALAAHWSQVREAYGDAGISGTAAFSPLPDESLGALSVAVTRPFDRFILEALRLAGAGTVPAA